VDEVQMILDDQIVKIQSMRASPFIKPFEQTATTWEETLQTLQVGTQSKIMLPYTFTSF
jgi:dynein heavy chain